MLTIQSESRDPFINQALEEYLFYLPVDDPIIYLWQNDPAVVFGCYQNPYMEIDLPAMWRKDVSVVRRISGGGTVYHDPGNINYTWIATPSFTGVQYEPFLRPLADALRSIGFPVEIKNECDIYLGDKKVSGSAQKRRRGRLLHHSTLLYDCDLTALHQSGPSKRESFEGKGVPSRPARVGNLSALNWPDAPETKVFLQELYDALGLDNARIQNLTTDDLDAVARLADEKYRAWEWTYGRAPWFRFSRRFTLANASYDVNYEAKKGVIVHAQFRVNGLDRPDMTASFIGSKLEYRALEAWSKKHLTIDASKELL